MNAINVELTDDGWLVVGDLHDAMTVDEFARLRQSPNYLAADAAHRLPQFTGVSFDPESSCFFAYAPSEKQARALADYLLTKTWMA